MPKYRVAKGIWARFETVNVHVSAHKSVSVCVCGGLVCVCCWPQGARLRPNYLSGVDITYPLANHTQRTTGPCSKALVICQLS